MRAASTVTRGAPGVGELVRSRGRPLCPRHGQSFGAASGVGWREGGRRTRRRGRGTGWGFGQGDSIVHSRMGAWGTLFVGCMGAGWTCRATLSTPWGQAAATAALAFLLGSDLLYALLNLMFSALWIVLPFGLPLAKVVVDLYARRQAASHLPLEHDGYRENGSCIQVSSPVRDPRDKRRTSADEDGFSPLETFLWPEAALWRLLNAWWSSKINK